MASEQIHITKEESVSVRQMLMKLGLLELFSLSDADVFLKSLMKKNFPAGEKVIIEGDTNDFVYFIKKGEVMVRIRRKNDEIPVKTLGEGEFFGEIGVVAHQTRTATVTAKTPLEVYMIYREDFRKLLNQNPPLAARFEKMIQLRRRETKQLLALKSFVGIMKKILFKKIQIRLRRGSVKALSKLVRKSSRILIFTGAGISKESGFTEIHGKGGVWDRFQIVSFSEFVQDPAKRKEYWRRKKEFMSVMTKAKPGPSHLAIAQLEKSQKLIGIVTQNIDGLHQTAGNSSGKVIELNGTNCEMVCLLCGQILPWEKIYQKLMDGIESPACEICGGLIKPNTISVGQIMDAEIFLKALSWAEQCDLFIAVGSSLTSDQARQIIAAVKKRKVKFVVINLSETAFDNDAHFTLKMRSSDALPKALA